MKKIALYTRRSIYSEESESIKMQIDACRDYFKREECEFEEFIDEGYSGSNIDRPDFTRMRNKIHKGEFNAVVVYKIDRISRNMVDFINLVNDFEQYGVPLISVTEGADPTTPAGKFVMNILASVAEMERANTIQRVTDNMITLAKQGRWTGGNTPIGYKSFKAANSGTYLTVDEEQRDLAIGIYKKYLECESLNETANFFNKNIASISDMLSSPVYVPSSERMHTYFKTKGFAVEGEINGKGYITYGKRPKVKNRKAWNTSGYIVARSFHEPLIDEESWLMVQDLLQKNSIEPRPKQSANSYLNTLIKCARCGSNMIIDLTYTRIDGTKIYSFACGKRRKNSSACDNGYIMVDELENSIEAKLREMGLSKNKINEFIDNDNQKSYSKDIITLKKKVDKNNLQINNLTDKLAMMSNETSMIIINRIEQLAKDNQNIQLELIKLEGLEDRIAETYNNLDTLYNNIIIFNNMGNADINDKRKIIRSIIDHIDFDKEKNIARINLRT